MLLYTFILVACIIVAVVIPWLYRLVSGAGTVILQTISPRCEKGPTSHLKANSVRLHTHSLSAYRSLETHGAPIISARTHDKRREIRQEIAEDASYYGPRNIYISPTHAKVQLPSAGWLQREDSHSAAGRAYKVTRRLKIREKNPKIVSKPASWQ